MRSGVHYFCKKVDFNESMEESWYKIKAKYWTGAFFFAFLAFFSFFWPLTPNVSDLAIRKVKLSSDPIWKESHRKGGAKYWINLRFNDEFESYSIDGFDYKYIDYSAFIADIREGDSLTIGTYGTHILSLEKNGIQYLNFDKAQLHKEKNKTWACGLFLTGLTCCVIPLFFKTYPTLRIGRQEIRFHFGVILVVSLIIVFVVLYNKVGFEYISGGQFAK